MEKRMSMKCVGCVSWAVIVSALLVFSHTTFAAEPEEVPVSSMDQSVAEMPADTKASVVKVYSVKSNPNYFQPWQNNPQYQVTGSGAVIGGNRILTNAHVVADAAFIMIRKQGDPKKYSAKLLIAGHRCDLAILKVEDESFFQGMKPLDIGDLPLLQDKVAVLGYPVGGDNISITEGVVSRIEATIYSHCNELLLSVQIDAAINPGNSGGPVVKDGKLVGVAFQEIKEGQNLGYMIPPTVIKHFLEDVKDGIFAGFPGLDFSMINMESPDMRKWARMNEGQTGVLVTHLTDAENRKGFFKNNDVILEINGVKVANDGSVPLREGELIFFGYIYWQKNIGDKCHFKILREGAIVEFDYPLGIGSWLVPKRTYDVRPSFFITGGLLFVPLTENYLDAWEDWSKAPVDLVDFARNGEANDERDQIVVLSEVLADDVNMGYQNTLYVPVSAVNSSKVKNIRDLVGKIEAVKTGFVEILLSNNDKIVLDVEKARKANAGILQRYNIDSDRSPDLKK